MSDKLRMDYINSLPQPFIATLLGGSVWPIHDIEVETGLMRIDVCGMLEVKWFSDVVKLVDGNAQEHDPETFYSDYEIVDTQRKDLKPNEQNKL